jgi:Plexin repeat
MTTDAAVVQLSPEMCSIYKYCTDCARDPYCGWDFVNNVCSPYQPMYVMY